MLSSTKMPYVVQYRSGSHWYEMKYFKTKKEALAFYKEKAKMGCWYRLINIVTVKTNVPEEYR